MIRYLVRNNVIKYKAEMNDVDLVVVHSIFNVITLLHSLANFIHN